MEEKYIHVYCGAGNGKSSAALGLAVKAACAGKSVFLIQFLKGRDAAGLDYMKKLEPEIKLFTFDKFERPFSELTDKEKEEELIHIRNGMNFAKKVLSTGECDLLILDEILGLSATGAVSQEELKALFDEMPDGMELILTGIENPKWLWPYVSEVTELVTDYQADET
jgi:cob(I)alamin adenosyltransferase